MRLFEACNCGAVEGIHTHPLPGDHVVINYGRRPGKVTAVQDWQVRGYEAIRGDLKPQDRKGMTATYMGVPISMFDRDELIEICQRMGEEIQNMRKQHRDDMQFLGDISRARRRAG